MQIALVSRDDSLKRLCSDALAGSPARYWNLLLQAGNNSARLRHDRDTVFDCLLENTLRLQAYGRDRMNFLARAVHDFRTPLTAVNMLLSGQLATAPFQWSSATPADLDAEKSISFELDLEAPEQPVRFDTAQTEQSLVNLMENSC